MENFDRENVDKLLEIRKIRQYFPPSKFFTVRYLLEHVVEYSEICSPWNISLAHQNDQNFHESKKSKNYGHINFLAQD